MQLPGVNRRTGTQANCTDDDIEKNNGTQDKARQQGSARRFLYPRRNHRGLAICASRVSNGRTGILHERAGTTTRRQTVNLTRGGNRTVKEYITYLGEIRTSVYNWICNMKSALLVLISTYVWDLGQANPMGGTKEP